MPNVIYILGLGHSGSTVFGMMMASGGKAIGLGEVRSTLQVPIPSALKLECSCGVIASECPFWGLALDRLRKLDPGATLAHRYEVIFQVFDGLFGAEAYLVDASKNQKGLTEILSIDGKRSVEPILIVKDVRGYAISALENIRRKGRGGALARRAPEIIFQDWYRRNRGREAVVRQHFNRAPLVVTYELLCLNTQEAGLRIAAQLGVPFIASGASPGTGVTHIISGNRMRHDVSKVSRLRYDYRWFFREEWVRPYSLMPWVRTYNKHLHAGELRTFEVD